MHKSGYNYAKTVQARVNIMNITGKGIIWAGSFGLFCIYLSFVLTATCLAGDAHVRQRKIMSPAFSSAQLRSFLPVFHQSANKVPLAIVAASIPLTMFLYSCASG